MRSETLDITIEERGGDLWFILQGPFTQEQLPAFRERFITLLDDGARSFIIDIDGVTAVDSGAPQLFVQLLNTVKGKNGDVRLVYKNESVTRAFAPVRNLFTVYADTSLLRSGGVIALIMKQQRLLSRKTGIRLSRPVAIFLLIVLCGWFISLVFIIHLQGRHIREQQGELQDLSQWETRSRIEIDNLRSRLLPLEQLGILRDSTQRQP